MAILICPIIKEYMNNYYVLITIGVNYHKVVLLYRIRVFQAIVHLNYTMHNNLKIKIQVTGFSLCMEMTSVFVQGEVDMHVESLDENRMPVLVIQQAAQGEVQVSISRGQVSIALKERKIPHHVSPVKNHGFSLLDQHCNSHPSFQPVTCL
jgi:hypothetical protein